MLPRNHPDRIRIVFDDRRLVANAGLLLPANRTSPRTRASPVCECLLLRPLPAISP